MWLEFFDSVLIVEKEFQSEVTPAPPMGDGQQNYPSATAVDVVHEKTYETLKYI